MIFITKGGSIFSMKFLIDMCLMGTKSVLARLIFHPSNRFRALLCLALFLISFAKTNAQQFQDTNLLVIQNARIIIGDGSVIENGSLQIEGDSVVQVSVEMLEPDNAQIINATGKTIIPALIDGHSHLGYQGRGDWGAHNYGLLNLIDNLEQYAYYGFSAVFSAGSDSLTVMDSVEKERREGNFNGPRILFAAGMAPPNQGPNDQFLTHALAVERRFGEIILYGLEDPAQAREQVKIVFEKGFKFIKIWVDDRGGSQSKLSPEIYAAVIDEASDLGLKVFVHQQFATDMPPLLSAGAHGFLHGRIGSDLGEGIANQIRTAGAFVVPNWGLGELRQEAIGEDDFLNQIYSAEEMSGLTKNFSRRYAKFRNSNELEVELASSFMSMLDVGVDIVLGTDAGAVPNHPFGYTGHRELEIYVRLGMSPMQAIIAATSNAAKHLGLTDLGLLKAGYSADFIILDENPLEEIRNTRTIDSVYLSGNKIDRAALQRGWNP